MRNQAAEGGALRALGAWTLADQGVVSLGTFLTNVILARSLTPSEFGVYGVYLAILLTLNTIHSSLVIYPLTTSSAASSPSALRGAATGSLLLTAGLWAPLLAALPLAGIAIGHRGTLLPALAVVVCWQTQETMRRALMAGLRHREAVWGDALSYLGQALAVWLLVRAGAAGLGNVFWTMALTSLAAAAVQWLQLGLGDVTRTRLWRLGCDAWRLGKWTLASNVAGILSSQLFIWAVAGFRGPAEAGALLAVFNVLGASHPLLFSLGNLIVPAASGAFRAGGPQAAWRTAWKYGRQGIGLAAPCLLLLAAFPELALRLLYGSHSGYVVLAAPMRWGALAYVFLFVGQVFGCYLGALREVKRVFRVQMLGGAIGLAAGLPLAIGFGVGGACVGLCAVNMGRLLAGGALSYPLLRSQVPEAGDLLRAVSCSLNAGPRT
ncbi:MAG: hypothetical protein IT159_14390 [Bryobacterales bacterium]|nr:hypothetical protein [Bryobacterales bacterium]